MENGSGFRINSWRDVLTVLMIMGFTTSAFVWLMKLDGRSMQAATEVTQIRERQDDVRDRLTSAEARLDALRDRVAAIESGR